MVDAEHVLADHEPTHRRARRLGAIAVETPAVCRLSVMSLPMTCCPALGSMRPGVSGQFGARATIVGFGGSFRDGGPLAFRDRGHDRAERSASGSG